MTIRFIPHPINQSLMYSITHLILTAFKAVSLIFACAAVFTGAQAIFQPVRFSRSFGLPIIPSKGVTEPDATATKTSKSNDAAESYISLMGVRQLATGITLLIFAVQEKWSEIATILSIIGVLVAGTDGYYLQHSGAGKQARFHAVPGALIAALAAAAWVNLP